MLDTIVNTFKGARKVAPTKTKLPAFSAKSQDSKHLKHQQSKPIIMKLTIIGKAFNDISHYDVKDSCVENSPEHITKPHLP